MRVVWSCFIARGCGFDSAKPLYGFLRHFSFGLVAPLKKAYFRLSSELILQFSRSSLCKKHTFLFRVLELQNYIPVDGQQFYLFHRICLFCKVQSKISGNQMGNLLHLILGNEHG